MRCPGWSRGEGGVLEQFLLYACGERYPLEVDFLARGEGSSWCVDTEYLYEASTGCVDRVDDSPAFFG